MFFLLFFTDQKKKQRTLEGCVKYSCSALDFPPPAKKTKGKEALVKAGFRLSGMEGHVCSLCTTGSS